MPDKSDPLNDCPDCWEHYCNEPFLTEAFASVGIEHNLSTFEMAQLYFSLYHEAGHSFDQPSKKKGKR